MCSVGLGLAEEAAVKHGGVAEGIGGGVAAGQKTPCLWDGLLVSKNPSTIGRKKGRDSKRTNSLCSTIGATMVLGEPMDS